MAKVVEITIQYGSKQEPKELKLSLDDAQEISEALQSLGLPAVRTMDPMPRGTDPLAPGVWPFPSR